MDLVGDNFGEWVNLLVRWTHLVAGIAWIGSSFFFMWLDSALEKSSDPKRQGALWMVHSGGFYHVEKIQLSPNEIRHWAWPDAAGLVLIEQAMKSLHLSARAYFKILKMARTIADLENVLVVEKKHIAEAIQYRSLDRGWWKN